MTRENDYLNQTQAAEALGVSRMTVCRWIKEAKMQTVDIAGHRVITVAEVDRMKAERGEAGVPV